MDRGPLSEAPWRSGSIRRPTRENRQNVSYSGPGDDQRLHGGAGNRLSMRFPAPSSSVLFAPRPAPAAQISDARLALLFVADYRKMRSAAEVVVDDEPDLACRRPGHSKAYVREHPARTDVRALQPDSRSRRLAEQPHPVPEHDGDDLDDDLV